MHTMTEPISRSRGLSRIAAHLKSAGWSTAEYLFYPLLMLAATPFYVARLGTAEYGLWMLASAITGFGGAVNLGMGAATIRFVAARRGRNEKDDAVAVIRQTLSIALIGGTVWSAGLLLAAPWAARDVFQGMGNADKVSFTLSLAAVILFVQQFDLVYASAIKGMERFDVATKTDMSIKLATIFASLAIAGLTGSVTAVLITVAATGCAGALVRGAIASRIVGGAVLMPGWSRDTAREVFSFGAWNALQGLASSLFQNADRLLLGGFLGAGAVTYFSVCTQLAQQIHSLPAAAMAVILPLMSRRFGSAPAEGLARFQRYCVIANLLASGGLALLLWCLGPWFLEWWMGAEFSAKAASLLGWLTLAYFVMSLCVAPHFLLLGRGEARFVSLSNIVGGGVSLAAAFLLIPQMGMIGAAISRLAFGPVLLINYARLFKGNRL
jgi:O-antigen/teichoic acid export membrane protein